jgi:hypothetical protein
MTRGFRLLAAGVWLTLLATSALAHDETPKPVAELVVNRVGDRLTVTAHLPIAALADVNLPRGTDGHIDRNGIERPLQIVARELAASLELEQDHNPLPMPTLRATLTADESFVDVELGYVVRAGANNLSGRLRAFRAGVVQVPVVARFIVSPEITRTFEVNEGSERVTFDPDATTAIAYFVGRGARTLLDDWDVVLFVICLVVPIRAVHSRRSAVIALLVGEVAAASLTAGGWPAFETGTVPIVMAIAASALVIASLQAIVSPASPWLAPLALLFGLANGFALGQAFRDTLSFAGDHSTLSFVALIAVVVFEQLWLAALLSVAIALLYRWGVPERVAVIAAAAVVCHEALNRAVERAALVAEGTTITLDHFLTALTLGWALAVLLAGLLSARAGFSSPAQADTVSARP